MYFKITSYLKFILKSSNEHGVHSPFVFKYVTRCLYSKTSWNKRKSIGILLKSISYFESKSVAFLDDLSAAQIVTKHFPELEYDQTSHDLIFANEFDQFHFKQLLSDGKLHNDSIILIDRIHQNPRKEEEWKALIQLPTITVSMDMYWLGAIFIRKEQEKEHFTIRI